MGSPRLLMLDEPSLGLSPIMTDKLFETIRQIVQRGCSVLVAEQNVYATLKCSDRAYVVESGKVSASYSPQDIEHDPRLLLALLGQHADDCATSVEYAA
jgi:branched-chain amino acid transport system ATP-binding protein